ncbi:GNAT family N-acetyltransferase [Bradyrhizobium sp.]|uniref:GNAT family N-acetyltransferase n=1 Tax=Bradyrhizobium sp. TaxID=376 RepID=UPI0039E3178B
MNEVPMTDAATRSVSLPEDSAVPSFTFRVARSLAEIADLWPRTDSSSSAHCYAFQCADLLEVWCDTIGRARQTKTFFVGVFDASGQPVLLLPLGIERHRGMRILRFLDGGVSDYNAPILFRSMPAWEGETLERFWKGLKTALPTFDLAEFEKMPADICGVPNPIIGLAKGRYDRSGHVVTITTSWEEYAAKRLPYKRETSAQRRRLAKLGSLTFSIAETAADRQRILEAMMRQKSQRYIETWGVDGLDRPGYRQYYISLVERFAWPGPLLISALEVNGTILSTNWGLFCKGRFIGIVMSFEGGEWRRFSAGRLLLEDLLKWNFENHTSVFDFGIGDESYKTTYTDRSIELHQARIPVTTIGKAYEFGKDTRAWRYFREITRWLARSFARKS